MKTFILAALMTAVAGCAMAPTPAPQAAAIPAIADADPALWVVKDKDTTIYLFGTVHALDGKQDWFNDEIRTAYDASQEVVFEILPPDPATAGPKMIEMATDKSGKTLTSKLTPEQVALLTAELASVGAPANALDNFDPWFASTQLLQIRMAKTGIKPTAGAEATITAAAAKDGKLLSAVETFDWQIGLFDGLEPDLQLAMLTGYLENLDEGDAVFARMVEYWSKGDVDALANVMNEALRETPELGKKLLDDRNANWAEWIDARMDKPGTVFMAVGAGHLGGAGSVQDMLKKRGIKTRRIDR